jgi:hypothetical protein
MIIAYMEGEAREATEIQNIQIADGNIVRGLALPIYMVFPRLFTCSTTLAKAFKVNILISISIPLYHLLQKKDSLTGACMNDENK